MKQFILNKSTLASGYNLLYCQDRQNMNIDNLLYFSAYKVIML